jgi:uncharacterized protein with NRDE domain
MCLILLALRAHPEYPLVIAANRDEFYARPTAAAELWEDSPRVLAGRDLVCGGTWLGVDVDGRFAAVSNFRDGRKAPRPQAPSRGLLVTEYLTGAEPVTDYLSSVQARRDLYNGFNLIAGDLTTVLYGSNRTPSPRRLDSGIFGVSNHSLDTPWPKLERGKAGLRRLLGHRALDIEALFALLADRRISPDADLPDTGVGIEWERFLSPIFIESAHYGTRSSTVLLFDRAGRLVFIERSFKPGQEKLKTRRFDVTLGKGVRAPTKGEAIPYA